MGTLAQALAEARAAHEAGDLARAERLYRGALEADPNHAEVWYRLGRTQRAGGRPSEAVASYRQSLRLQPDHAERHAELAEALAEQGDADGAVVSFRQALRLRPEDAEAHVGLGSALAKKGDRVRAVASYREALRLDPGHAEAHAALGVALAEQGRLDEAVASLRQALRLRPEHARAHHNLGVALAEQGQLDEAVASLRQALHLRPDYAEACYNLGNTLGKLGRAAEAAAAYRRALEIRPLYADACNNLGLALTEAGLPGEAEVLLRQAVRLRPAFAEGHNNLGLALAAQGRFAEAEAAYGEALRLNPGSVEAHTNLGSAYKEQGRLDEAQACYQFALWLDPSSPSAHWNRALAWLQAGDFERGWAEYEWRWRRKKSPPRPFRQPRWDGAPLAGRTILLHAEQGLGDTLQFVRYAAAVKARGGTVVLAGPRALLPLLASAPGVDRLVDDTGALPETDVHAPLLSLPLLLGTTLATVPGEVPYLGADAARVGRWRERLRGLAGRKVGIVWQGNPGHQWDRHRSAPLAAFAPLARVAGVSLVSLQKGEGAEQLRAAGLPVHELGEDLDREGAFLDTAAVMRCLDLVVTVDTAAAHLAGALGIPVWVALASIADWRWLRDREDSPWYPSMRLFRQQAPGQWEGVFARMASELHGQSGRRGRLPAMPVTPGELLDKLTILQIKGERITDPAKLADVRAELAAVGEVAEQACPRSEELGRLTAELRSVNAALWDVEDALRVCERQGDFGPGFVELARSVYRHNDRRAALKRQLNQLLGAPYSEQKSYASYAGPGDG
jgi:tetratricopeptide (TPR) repeat protein